MSSKKSLYENQLVYIIDNLNIEFLRSSKPEGLKEYIYENFFLNKLDLDFENEQLNIGEKEPLSLNFLNFFKYDSKNSILEIDKEKFLVGNDDIDYFKMLYLKKTSFTTEKSFYHFFTSNNIDINFPEALVRFYINCKFENTIELIDSLMDYLNFANISFSIKCFKNQKYYNRSDNVILYMYKFDLPLVYDQIISIFELNSKYLNAKVPYFTLPLIHGVGFGENVISQNESFGSLRSGIISNAILENFKSGNNFNMLEGVNKFIFDKGFILDKFYLNPNSKYPYKF